MASSTWYQPGEKIVDIGGSKLALSLDEQLSSAFRTKGYLPKELAYADDGMEKWTSIAATSYQTTDEMAIIEKTAHQVVSALPSGTAIIDAGCGDSRKYEPYVRAFVAQGKSCTYVPLDLNKDSLIAQVSRAKATFPSIDAVGLWGDFDDGDRFYCKITTPARLFLSLGSIFFNAPESMCDSRCQAFKAHLSQADRLIVGQDGPTDATKSKAHASYGTPAYNAFIAQYLRTIQTRAGIREIPPSADPMEAWSVTSKSEDTKHFFELTAKIDMYATKFDNFPIPAGTTYEMFPSWKRSESNCVYLGKKNRLSVETIGQSPTSGMRQFMLKNN